MVQAPLPRALLLQSLQNLLKETKHPRGELGLQIRKEGKGKKIGRDRKDKIKNLKKRGERGGMQRNGKKKRRKKVE